jgi:hypothetical protein
VDGRAFDIYQVRFAGKAQFNPQRLQVIVVYPTEQAGLFSVLT